MSLSSALQQVAATIGQTLELEAGCRGFLKVLANTLDLSDAWIWLDGELIHGLNGATAGEAVCVAMARNEPARRRISRDHLLFACVDAQHSIRSSKHEERFAELAGVLGIDSGHLVMLPLRSLGEVVLFNRNASLSAALERELEPLCDRLAVALEGSLAHTALAFEIAARKRAELANRHQEQRRQALIEHVEDIVLILEYDGTVAYASPSATKLLGLEPAALIGRAVFEYIHPEDLNEIYTAFRSMVATGSEGSHSCELRVRSATQEWRDLEMVLNNKLTSPAVKGVVFVGHDITERKRRAIALQEAQLAAEAASRAKGSFLASMSHEIRTPLNAVIGLSQLLGRTKLDSTQQEYIDVVQTSAHSLLALINDILDLSKIESGKLELETGPFDLVQTIEDALNIAAPLASTKGLRMAFRFSPELPTALIGDADRLRQILVNLLSNAVKFTPSGEITIAARLVDQQEETAVIQIEVSDTGLGIPEGHAEELFAPFVQISGSNKQAGTGLGLNICKRLVELMGGKISVDSTFGEGSTFSFTFEALVKDDTTWASAFDYSRETRVLVVEANETIRELLADVLGIAGAWPLTAGSVDHAIKLFETEEAVDLAIIDGDLAGLEMLAIELFRNPPELTLLLSSYGNEPDAQVVELLQPELLHRPLRPSQLISALRRQQGGLGHERRREDRFKTASLAQLRVLLVEDNEVNQKVGRAQLGTFGIVPDIAESGRAAIAKAKATDYDLVLMDLHLGDLDGLEATHHLLDIDDPQAHRPRIVAMTASALSEDRQASLDAGMSGFISKPVELGELARELEATLAGIEPERLDLNLRAILDPEALRKLDRDAKAGGALITDLSQAWRHQAPTLHRQLVGAHERADREAVIRVAHTLRGSSHAVGLLQVAYRCEAIEGLAATGRLSDCAVLLERLDGELEASAAALLELELESNDPS